MTGPLRLCCLLTMLLTPMPMVAAEHAEHVVLMVWDGLRPDTVTRDTTPNLYALMQRGVDFAHHHAVFITSTEVNGTALATGCTPAHSGIVANREYRPGIDPLKSIATEELAAVRAGDRISQDHYLLVPTVPEILHAQHQQTGIAGTKPVALLFDRAVRPERHDDDCADCVLFQGQTLPAGLLATIVASQGAFPPVADSTKAANAAQDAWTTHAFLEVQCAKGIPRLGVVWLSEVDYAQHGSGPGSPVAQAALKSSDDCLGLVIARLQAAQALDRTDILIVSDHGFSTISKAIDLSVLLQQAGFKASREFTKPPVDGDVLVVGLGGSAAIYVAGHDAGVTAHVVEFLHRLDGTGLVFTAGSLPGTFPLSTVCLDSSAPPDVIVSFAWSDQPSATGVPGLLVSDGTKRKPGQGNHASLSPFDVHNTLIAAGPDFKSGWKDALPTGNLDIAPTILAILQIPPTVAMDGRVLGEALTWGTAPTEAAVVSQPSVQVDYADLAWEQHLRISRLGSTLYLDEGAGTARRK